MDPSWSAKWIVIEMIRNSQRKFISSTTISMKGLAKLEDNKKFMNAGNFNNSTRKEKENFYDDKIESHSPVNWKY
jgi:hypothetical protein